MLYLANRSVIIWKSFLLYSHKIQFKVSILLRPIHRWIIFVSSLIQQVNESDQSFNSKDLVWYLFCRFRSRSPRRRFSPESCRTKRIKTENQYDRLIRHRKSFLSFQYDKRRRQEQNPVFCEMNTWVGAYFRRIDRQLIASCQGRFVKSSAPTRHQASTIIQKLGNRDFGMKSGRE